MTLVKRSGIDHDPIKPYQLATIVGHSTPVEVISYPIPAEGDTGAGMAMDLKRATVMIRDCPSGLNLREVPLRYVACFSPDRYPEPELNDVRGDAL